jgi:hypothetical protein
VERIPTNARGAGRSYYRGYPSRAIRNPLPKSPFAHPHDLPRVGVIRDDTSLSYPHISLALLGSSKSTTLAQNPGITYESATRLVFIGAIIDQRFRKIESLRRSAGSAFRGCQERALDNAERAVAELNELGFHYILTEGASSASPARAPRKASSQAPKRQARDLPCPICEFKTTPHHDGRMHRSQKAKHPFTVEELMEKHLAKVG